MMLLAPIPWTQRVWALPFFTVLAASPHYNQRHRRRHKKLTDWGRQMIRQLRRWLTKHRLVVVADSTYSVLELLACAARMIEPVAIVTRLQMVSGSLRSCSCSQAWTQWASSRWSARCRLQMRHRANDL